MSSNLQWRKKHMKSMPSTELQIHAAVVAFVAGSLEAVGLPGYPEVF